MIKNINNNKIMIISHIADIDGMGSIILAKNYYKNEVDYILCEVKDLPDLFANDDFTNYETIYLCDLSLSPSAIDVLNNRNDITEKLKHFDHHSSYKDDVPLYVNAHVLLNDRKTCGTELYYNYLISINESFKNDFYDKFVEATREQDTWEFGIEDYYAKMLASTYSLIGPNEYIKLICSLDSKKEFQLPHIFDELYKIELEKQERYINNINDNLLITNYENYKIGVTIAEQYRSIIGDEICKKRPELDFVLIINYNRNSCSLRCVKDNIDLNKICTYFHPDGGGHKKAAGFVIDSISIPKIKDYNDMYLQNIKE